jgi:transcriptional regulator with XRE-family HTH domain
MPASLHTAAADFLAEEIIKRRKAAGLTQRQLAAALGREQNFVARLETRERRIDLVELIQILRVLGADPERELAVIARQLFPLVPKLKKRAQ